MKKTLLAIALIPTLMPFAAFAEDQNINQSESAPVSTEESSATEQTSDLSKKASELGGKLWKDAVKALKEAKLRRKVSIPTIELAKGLNVGANYQLESAPSIGGFYSGIDVWEVNLAAYPQLFGIDSLPGDIGAGANFGRNITYIQQFKKQKDSILRVPYDPITKIPLKADIFFKKSKNIFTGKEEMALKPGDFIAYRAPMTFSLGKGFSSIGATHLGISAGLSYAISGEFDVHVFVMENNLVRVKILAAKGKSFGASAGVSLLGFNGLGELVVKRLLDTNVLQLFFSKSATDLFIADYIFNLNKEESRELYNTTVGSKLHVFSLDTIKKHFAIANPFASDISMRNKLIADLTNLNEVASADLNKPYSERRIFKLLNAHNDSETISHGMRLSLLKIIKGQSSTSKTGSKITIYAQNDSSVKAKFKLDAYSSTSSFEYFIWGDKASSTDSLLTQTDLNNNPIEFIGLQNSKVNEDKLLKKKELAEIMSRFQRILPESIYSKLETPNWNFKKGTVKNAYIQQDITFNTNLFKLPSEVTEETIRNALLEIVNNYGKLKSEPIGVKSLNSDTTDPVMDAFQRGNYAEAYGYEVRTMFGGEKRIVIEQEMQLIPQKLSVALSGQYSFADRYAAFSYLYEKIPLFNEISTILLLKVVPEKILERVVIVRIAMSAKEQTPLITDYPSTETFNTSNLFREILAQNGYINDRSYNLRHYLKENGTQYTIDEIMIEKK